MVRSDPVRPGSSQKATSGSESLRGGEFRVAQTVSAYVTSDNTEASGRPSSRPADACPHLPQACVVSVKRKVIAITDKFWNCAVSSVKR